MLRLIVAFILGILIQRIYAARSKGFSRLGNSWEWSQNKIYRTLHRVYCELCPRRLYCERYHAEMDHTRELLARQSIRESSFSQMMDKKRGGGWTLGDSLNYRRDWRWRDNVSPEGCWFTK
jgi:hypothetical protein